MFDLNRFLQAQNSRWDGYDQALSEIRSGKKVGHWIWYIFPQIHGLGRSDTSRKYAIVSLEEARAYAAHPVLGPRLTEISRAMLTQTGGNPYQVMGHTDAMKLCSCMTLFELADPENGVYAEVLEKYYRGRRDRQTLRILGIEP